MNLLIAEQVSDARDIYIGYLFQRASFVPGEFSKFWPWRQSGHIYCPILLLTLEMQFHWYFYQGICTCCLSRYQFKWHRTVQFSLLFIGKLSVDYTSQSRTPYSNVQSNACIKFSHGHSSAFIITGTGLIQAFNTQSKY